MAGLAGQFLIGHELNGRYRLAAVLGEGGFGVVFRAEDLERGRDVAVKVLDPPRGMTPPQVERLRQRFVHEAEIASRLPLHPNLVRVLDFGSTDKLDFLVMELLRGESLRERLARPEPVSLRSALHLLRDAARGVAVGHENGLVHRDLKPANIFLENAGGAEPHVRILDFGIAKLLDEDEEEETRTHLTLPGEWFGSEPYCPPEHLRRESVTRASDVYSLGVVAFELLTRSRLFSKDDMVRRKQGLPVPIPSMVSRNPDVPREVEVIVRRALAEDASARYDDAGELATELHRALSRLRRAADLPGAAAAAEAQRRASDDATAVIGDEGTVLAGQRASDDATALAATPDVLQFLGLKRRGRDLPDDPTGLEAELERVRRARRRKRAVQAVTVAAMGLGAVAGGFGLVVLRAESGPPAAVAPARVLSAAEENDEGLRKFRRGEYAGAVEAFARAMRKAPGQAEFANNYAYALLRAGRTHEAVTALGDVVARHPEREVAYSNLAEAQLVAGDTAGAIASMQSLLAMDPSPGRRREAETFLDRLGAMHSDTQEWEDVREAPAVSLPDVNDPSTWDDWVASHVDAQTDTVYDPRGGMTITSRVGTGGLGVVRRRTWNDRDGWRDTLFVQPSRDASGDEGEAQRWP
ncbi:protein kinase domain-containing protein [Longimicrobium sp.]|uniref:protein kinase domain-containing protein n=1 Tax=Longimicrobium sp. TaxID=2029185 RepID=UPI002E30753C|nr:protein kinase [Longimicrobium sp.]HEX6038274.1 protein kinase [Longimicrobium sp.]